MVGDEGVLLKFHAGIGKGIKLLLSKGGQSRFHKYELITEGDKAFRTCVS